MTTPETLPSSFRDPSGSLFAQDGRIYRRVNDVYRDDYDRLLDSGLYEELTKSQLLVPHEEVDPGVAGQADAYRVLAPRVIPFISYPYEWCFSQLKDAALATLRIQGIAIEHGMSLKDCSAYNIQFADGRPLLIDTLSFEKYKEGQPWVAYRQFCQHFLAPLALMSYEDVRLNQLLRIYIDGIPLDLASALLGSRTRLRFSLLIHLHIHARSQAHFSDKAVDVEKKGKVSKNGLLAVVRSLESAIRKLRWQPKGTEWGDYYDETNYSADAFDEKKKLVGRFLDTLGPKTVWDLGANDGLFSRLASGRGSYTVSLDTDPVAVEKNYLRCVADGEERVLPLLMDLTNPSSSIGWEHRERMSLMERGPADTALALALIHHLAISNNVPLERVAGFLSEICNSLIIEFVPKQDSQVQRLLATREDIFDRYDLEGFEEAFSRFFVLVDSERIGQSERTIYCMKKR